MVRSYLFVPAKDEYKMHKAVTGKADAVIFDLEDSIESGSKEKARQTLKNFIDNYEGNKYTVLRINGLDTPHWHEDIKVTRNKGIDAIMIPKVHGAKDIEKVVKHLQRYSVNLGEIIPIIENVQGLNATCSILKASQLVRKVAFGAVDFCLDLNINVPHSTLLDYIRVKLVLDSRLAGKEKPIDSVYEKIDELEPLREEAERAKQLGLYGKMAIHPAQIDVIHQAYAVTEEGKKEAKIIVKLFEKANEEGKAAIQFNGKMIDYPVYERAKTLLKYD